MLSCRVDLIRSFWLSNVGIVPGLPELVGGKEGRTSSGFVEVWARKQQQWSRGSMVEACNEMPEFAEFIKIRQTIVRGDDTSLCQITAMLERVTWLYPYLNGSSAFSPLEVRCWGSCLDSLWSMEVQVDTSGEIFTLPVLHICFQIRWIILQRYLSLLIIDGTKVTTSD